MAEMADGAFIGHLLNDFRGGRLCQLYSADPETRIAQNSAYKISAGNLSPARLLRNAIKIPGSSIPVSDQIVYYSIGKPGFYIAGIGIKTFDAIPGGDH